MNTRIAQLLSRFIYVGLFAVAGRFVGEVPADTAASLSTYADAIGAALAGVILVGVDLWLHRKQKA